MMVEPVQFLKSYHEKDSIRIRSNVYGENSKLTNRIKSYDANSSYIYFSRDTMSCGKDVMVVNKKSFDKKQISNFSRYVLKGEVFGFAQGNIEVPNEIYQKFSETAQL